MDINVRGPSYIELFGGIKLSASIVIGWIIIIAAFFFCRWLTKDLKKVPDTKRQAVAEMLVTTMNKMVDENMGAGMRVYAPYLATIFVFALIGALVSLLGIRSMTVDINVTATWAVMSFVLITYNKIEANGFKGYLKGLASPAILTPFNILSEVATPVAMALRMFGNMAGGMIITTMLYAALGAASSAVYSLIGFSADTYYFSIFQVGIPAVLSLYFDLFSGVIQSYVFIMLTMAYIKNGREG